MAEQQPAGSGMNWVVGCGLGCGVLLLIVIVIAVAIFMAARRGIDSAREEMREDIRTSYDRHLQAGNIPEEHRTLIESVVAQSQREETGIFGITLVYTAVTVPLEEGELTEEDVRAIQELHALLEEDPSPGVMRMSEFMARYPELQRRAPGQGFQPGTPMDAPAPAE